jgi:hypothetical protein
MKRVFIFLFTLAMVFGFSVIAHATLWDRGDGLIYDDELNITWLQDANLAATSTFGVGGITDGKMTWETANAWVAAMNAANYLGYNDWRLAEILPVNGSSYNYNFSFIGLTDYGWNVSAPGSAYAGSTGSEMAYVYYNNSVIRDTMTSTEIIPRRVRAFKTPLLSSTFRLATIGRVRSMLSLRPTHGPSTSTEAASFTTVRASTSSHGRFATEMLPTQ